MLYIANSVSNMASCKNLFVKKTMCKFSQKYFVVLKATVLLFQYLSVEICTKIYLQMCIQILL